MGSMEQSSSPLLYVPASFAGPLPLSFPAIQSPLPRPPFYPSATLGLDLTADMIKPRARSAPMVCVLRNSLWLWGGNVEVEHTDVNLDDLFCLVRW